MNIYQEIEAEIKAASNIVITSHKSADGDPIGSSLGLLHFIEKLGKTATVCHPDALFCRKSFGYITRDKRAPFHF